MLQKKIKKNAFFVYSSTRVSPNNFTFTFLFKSCQSYDDLDTGRELHTHVVKFGFGAYVFVQNIVLFQLAIELFKYMEERNAVSWNLFISGLAKRGEMEPERLLFEEMITWNAVMKNARLGLDNEVSWNAVISGYTRNDDSVVSWTAMISGYAKVGDVGKMNNLFDLMPVKNVISWNPMIADFVQSHKFDQALEVFHRMLLVLSACTLLGAQEQGKWIKSYIQKRDVEISTSLGNALIDMFAILMFNQLRKKCTITWTSMVAGLAFNGQCKEAFALFNEMCVERIQPDDVIFIAVLSACTHGFLVKWELEEAYTLITSMSMKPNAVIWATLLGFCKLYGQRELLEVVTKKIPELGHFKFECSAMKKEAIEKVPGSSLIQVKNKIFKTLDSLYDQLKTVGIMEKRENVLLGMA
ncbi:hypothetical protein MKW98_032279 [Papaver atlanticum]|uniref:Pentatricopeptide repeat-containing protein n=1 Tax=Papaver atlanticum TaxID=357466 RepID=A0AAD4SGU0_9MAGN|nr:hypothetical protein MKW98_032279 [Papaver atlanticum]